MDRQGQIVVFPFAEFLATLEPHGVRAGAQDVRRIQWMMATSGAWSRDKLRNSLVSLLAKSPDERRAVSAAFDDFFPADHPFPAQDSSVQEPTRQRAKTEPIEDWIARLHPSSAKQRWSQLLARCPEVLESQTKERLLQSLGEKSHWRADELRALLMEAVGTRHQASAAKRFDQEFGLLDGDWQMPTRDLSESLRQMSPPFAWKRLAIGAALALSLATAVAWLAANLHSDRVASVPEPTLSLPQEQPAESSRDHQVRTDWNTPVTVDVLPSAPQAPSRQPESSQPQRSSHSLRISEAPSLGTAIVVTQGLPHPHLQYTPRVGTAGQDRFAFEFSQDSPAANSSISSGRVILTIRDPMQPTERLVSKPVLQVSSQPQLNSALPLALLVLLGSWTMVWLGYLLADRWISPPSEPLVDLEDPERFDPGRVGGLAWPMLSARDLDDLADSVGFFRPEAKSRELDLEKTVAATCQRGGLVQLVHAESRELRTVVVLEDVYSTDRSWNTLAQELASGLRKRRVPVLHCHFRRTPDALFRADGSRFKLEDLAADPNRYLVFCFSDGTGLSAEDLGPCKALSELPYRAWLDLREPRFWDAGSAAVIEAGLPIFPASPQGVGEAFEFVLADRTPAQDYESMALRWWGKVQPEGAALEVEVPLVLGAALNWAEACSMMQPVSLGMAGALRRTFFDEVEPHLFGRLLRLRGSRLTASGLYFSRPVLSTLRSGFRYQAEEDQEAILGCLLREVERVRPAHWQEHGADSLAQLSWKKSFYRLQLELDPDAALEPLASLSKTPVGESLRAELSDVALPEPDIEEPAQSGPTTVPLRVAPVKDLSRQRLADLAPQTQLAPRKWLALSPSQKRITQGLSLLTLVAAAWFGWHWLRPPDRSATLDLPVPEQAVSRLRLSNGQLIPLSQEQPVATLAASEGQLRVEASIGGEQTHLTLPAERNHRITLTASSLEVPCRIEGEGAAATAERCPITADQPWTGPTFREKLVSITTTRRLLAGPQSPVARVGVELAGDSQPTVARVQELRDALIASSSVDEIWTLHSNFDLGNFALALEETFDPWRDRVELVWWLNGESENRAQEFEDRLDQAQNTEPHPNLASWARLDEGGSTWASQLLDRMKDPPGGTATRLVDIEGSQGADGLPMALFSVSTDESSASFEAVDDDLELVTTPPASLEFFVTDNDQLEEAIRSVETTTPLLGTVSCSLVGLEDTASAPRVFIDSGASGPGLGGVYCTYRTNAEAEGRDTFVYTLRSADSQQSASATVSIELLRSPIGPILEQQVFTNANPDRLTLDPVFPALIDVLANDDYDPQQPFALTLEGQPKVGRARVTSDQRIEYSQADASAQQTAYGEDAFSYTLTQGSQSSSAAVSLRFREPTAPAVPQAVDDSLSVFSDQISPLQSVLVQNDQEADDRWLIEITTQPPYGVVREGPRGTLVYQPRTGYEGPDRLTYRYIASSGEKTPEASVSIDVVGYQRRALVLTCPDSTLNQGEARSLLSAGGFDVTFVRTEQNPGVQKIAAAPSVVANRFPGQSEIETFLRQTSPGDGTRLLLWISCDGWNDLPRPSQEEGSLQGAFDDDPYPEAQTSAHLDQLVRVIRTTTVPHLLVILDTSDSVMASLAQSLGSSPETARPQGVGGGHLWIVTGGPSGNERGSDPLIDALSGLVFGDADANGDSLLTGSEMGAYTLSKLSATREFQPTWLYDSQTTGEFQLSISGAQTAK